MSSPFETFRKNRTYWMAALVLLAIISFIVAPAIQMAPELMGTRTSEGNQVIVRWIGGKITQKDAYHLRQQYQRMYAFMQRLASDVVENGGEPQVPDFRFDQRDPQKRVIAQIGIPEFGSEHEMCQALIIAERGKQLGISFDDEAINEFLRKFCDGKVSNRRLAELLDETAGKLLSKSDLYQQLGLALTVVVMQESATAGVGAEDRPLVTPGGAWQNFVSISKSATVEAYPMNVGKFLSEVKGTPSDAELKTIYEAGKDIFPSPNDSRPGFRRRYHAKLEYVAASWDKIAKEQEAKITEEQIKAEYDRRVALGGLKVPVDPPKPPAPPAAPDASKTLDKPAAGDQPPSPGKPAEAAPPADKPAEKPVEKPAEAPAVEPAKPESPAVEPKADEPKVEAPAEAPKADPPAADAPKQSAVTSVGAVRLVAFQQEVAGEKKAEDAKPADAATPAQPAVTPAAPAVVAPAPPADATSAPAAPAATSPGVGGLLPGLPGLGASSPAEPEMRVKTLEEAREEIVKSLASEAVRPIIEGKFKKIIEAMREYSNAYNADLAASESGVKAEKTAKEINLKKMAEAEGLEYGDTGMVDGVQLAAQPLGTSFLGNNQLANVVMQPQVPLFLPVQSIYINFSGQGAADSKEFSSWKTSDQQSYTPAFEDIREEVVSAWKLQQARTLASVAAEKLAKEVPGAGDDAWAKLSKEDQALVVKTLPFTWLTFGSDMQSGPRISFVQGLDTVGNEFMSKVFGSEAGKVVTAPDEGQNTYYVVRVIDMTPKDDVLKQRFESSRGMWRSLNRLDLPKYFSDWYTGIERQMGVQWLGAESPTAGAQ